MLNSHISKGNTKATHHPLTNAIYKKLEIFPTYFYQLQSGCGGQQGAAHEDRQRVAPHGGQQSEALKDQQRVAPLEE